MNACMNKLMSEWMDEWMNEWLNEWMNEWMNDNRLIIIEQITYRFVFTPVALNLNFSHIRPSQETLETQTYVHFHSTHHQ